MKVIIENENENDKDNVEEKKTSKAIVIKTITTPFILPFLIIGYIMIGIFYFTGWLLVGIGYFLSVITIIIGIASFVVTYLNYPMLGAILLGIGSGLFFISLSYPCYIATSYILYYFKESRKSLNKLIKEK